MRWINRIWTMALLTAAAAGCAQQCFIEKGVWQHTRDQLAGQLESLPEAGQCITPTVMNAGTPTTVLDPNRPIRYMSLAEAISLALEKGTRGSPALNGQGDDTLTRFAGAGGLSDDYIRVLALDPAIAQAAVESSLSKFDTVFQTSMSWNVVDRPIGTALDVFQAGRNGALNAIQSDNATFSTGLVKPLPTGGTAGITFNTVYQFTNLPAAVNPSYAPTLQFSFEQPLLQGFGTEINEIRAAHPGAQLINQFVPQIPNFGQPTNEGILITRIRYDQSRADFEVSVSQMVLNVETAYWNLYGAYWNLYGQELGLRLAYESWRATRLKHLAGGVGNVRLADVARTRGQYELFRSQRISALGQVLEAERQLRKLLSFPTEDGQRLVPSDTPTLSPYHPDYQNAIQEALELRPELVISREELKVAQLNLIEKKNRLLPDLRTFATYDYNAIGNRLDGGTPNNAFQNLAVGNFSNWQVGIRLLMPLGFRQGYSELRQAQLNVARNYAILHDQELKTEQFLARQYRLLFESYELIRARRAEREAYGMQLRLKFLLLGEKTDLSDVSVLEAQRFFADALASEYAAIVQYNTTLAAFEYAKGTLLKHNNIVIAEGDLPACAQERAAVHHERRTKALVLAERPVPVPCQDGQCEKNEALLPELPTYKPASLLMMEKSAKVPDDSSMSDLPSMVKTTGDMPGVPGAAQPESAAPPRPGAAWIPAMQPIK
jgi:outer membrane protein TolC